MSIRLHRGIRRSAPMRRCAGSLPSLAEIHFVQGSPTESEKISMRLSPMISTCARSHNPKRQRIQEIDKMLPDWIDSIVSVDTFFSPCARCCNEACKSSPRDRQANFFVFNGNGRDATACSHCKPDLEAEGAVILQIRRSSHHDVVKIQDLQKLCPEAVQGVQSYTINGQKVAFLKTRAVPKEARNNPACITCNRTLQDNNIFCSLECKKRKIHPSLDSSAISNSSSGDGPASPFQGEWGSFKSIRSNRSYSSCDDMSSPTKKRRKPIPRRSPFE